MILYCRRHDLAFCEKHGPTPCFWPNCQLVEEPRAVFCCVCSGLLRKEETVPFRLPEDLTEEEIKEIDDALGNVT